MKNMSLKENKSGRIVDVHAHILPGLDDGAANMDESLAMLRIAASEGITDMIATPHFKSGRYNASPARIQEALARLREAAREQGIPVRLYPGNEIFYFEGVEALLAEGKICTLNGSSYVLFEFYPYAPFSHLRNALNSVMRAGFQPVLAHAERYSCLLRDVENLDYLKSSGVLIQVNAAGVTGKSFSEKRFFRRILDAQLVDFVGTDAHDTHHRAPLLAKCAGVLQRKYGSEYARQILGENAREILIPADAAQR